MDHKTCEGHQKTQLKFRQAPQNEPELMTGRMKLLLAFVREAMPGAIQSP
jgi:hypothetical protein